MKTWPVMFSVLYVWSRSSVSFLCAMNPVSAPFSPPNENAHDSQAGHCQPEERGDEQAWKPVAFFGLLLGDFVEHLLEQIVEAALRVTAAVVG